MKLKLDENLPASGAESLRQAGHDVASVASQELCSASDERLIHLCRAEGRALVTLDLDFGNPLRFNPPDYTGIVVLRLPNAPTHSDLIAAMETLAAGLAQNDVFGKLWIVRGRRIRQYEPREDVGNSEP